MFYGWANVCIRLMAYFWLIILEKSGPHYYVFICRSYLFFLSQNLSNIFNINFLSNIASCGTSDVQITFRIASTAFIDKPHASDMTNTNGGWCNLERYLDSWSALKRNIWSGYMSFCTSEDVMWWNESFEITNWHLLVFLQLTVLKTAVRCKA